MEYDKIKALIEDMGKSNLNSIDIDFPDGTKISMKKEQSNITYVKEQKTEHEVKKEEIQEENIVKSPMVGTLYLKPAPNSSPYVTIGTKVKKGQVLCIIEAMKLMNEIESEYDGKIKEILVKDGQAVEYGKPLFKIG